MRGTTSRKISPLLSMKHFYPRTPCGVRHADVAGFVRGEGISIHVPRAGYDCAGTSARRKAQRFLSTYPVRGTTFNAQQRKKLVDISIHVPRAGYDRPQSRSSRGRPISIHVPRAGYDTTAGICLRRCRGFLSTYPVRGTTSYNGDCRLHRYISIHVPRAGYDMR